MHTGLKQFHIADMNEEIIDVSMFFYAPKNGHLSCSRPEKALKEFKKAIKLEPDDPEPYYELGNFYNTKSEQNEKYVRNAVFYYEKYLYLGGEKEEEVRKFLKSLK